MALQVAGAASSARRWLVDIPAWQVLLPAYRLRVEFERESENIRGPRYLQVTFYRKVSQITLVKFHTTVQLYITISIQNERIQIILAVILRSLLA